MANKPQIRFKDFYDEWEEKELGSFSEKETEKNVDMRFSEVFTNSAEYGIISQNEYFDREITNSGNLYGYYIAEPDDFVYNPRVSKTAPVGPIRRNKLGRRGILSPLYFLFKTHNVNNTFLEYYFINSSWNKFMKANGNSGARFDRFSISETAFMKMPISMPLSDIEQKLIGDFFNYISSLIISSQAKLDKAINLKKSMLEKMFPKDGAKVPELRFAGFSGEYENISVTKIFEITNERNHPELPILSASQEYGMVYRNEEGGSSIQYNKDNAVTYKRIQPGQFAIHLRSFQGGFAHSDKDGICSPAYTIMRFIDEKRHDEYYWKYLLTSERFIKSLELITYGIRDGRSISFEDFSTFSFQLPIYEEQQKIGQFFVQLDKTISAYKDELEKLKTVKKSLLEKMFV